MRIVIYSDFAYRQYEGRTYAEQPFVIFLTALAALVDRVTLLGRLDPAEQPWHFILPQTVGYVALPHYRRASEPLTVLAAAGRSALRFWHVLAHADTALLFGPSPLADVFALLALLRGRRVALGVRQDYVSYVRNRHPARRWLHAAAALLDASFRLLARRCSVIAVGPAQVHHYAHARRLLPLSVTLIGEEEVRAGAERLAGSRDSGLVVLSVGRLDAEKNALLLADVLAELRSRDERWRLTVCGDGPLEAPLRERLRERGVQDYATLCGFVPIGPSLREIYSTSDLFLHTSRTEGAPQVLFEAFAAGLPVVATDVGGVAATAQGAALLIPPNDPSAAAAALTKLVEDRELREQLVSAGLRIARQHTRERQCRLVVDFLLES
jgi:glycosyltransferase involved in cell wall biosynthesis